MSGNPFNDDEGAGGGTGNPFEDYSSAAVVGSGENDYGGGADSRANLNEPSHIVASDVAVGSPSSSPWKSVTTNSNAYTSAGSPADLSALRQREEELQRREQTLAYREARLAERETKVQELGQTAPNWPRCRPMIYHDIQRDIPENGRQLVKRVYFGWYIAVWVYLINAIASFSLMTSKATGAGGNFGMALIVLLIGTPVSFVFWYKPLYDGVKFNRSMNIFIFFLCYGFHILIAGIFAVGVQGWGGAGFIYVLEALTAGQIVSSVLSVISFASMVFEVIYGLWQIKGVQAYYRSKGMSVEKAQSEAATTVATSRLGQELITKGAVAGTTAAVGNLNSSGSGRGAGAV